jgi:hypothetical protein
MPKKSCTSNAPTLADLLADPIVQLVLKADHVTDEQLEWLTGVSLKGCRAESDLDLARNEKRGLSAKNYRPGVSHAP